MEQLEEFRRGLYPILLAGDVVAFRSYLSRWEDVVGDTAELAVTSDTQQRRTMATLLRSPQHFNLPPWQKEPALRSPLSQAPDGPSEPDIAPPMAGWDGSQSTPAPLAIATPSTPPEEGSSPPVVGALVRATEVFQLDMLTGEFIPQVPAPTPTVDAISDIRPPRKATTRKRRKPAGTQLVQLALLGEIPQPQGEGPGH
jgi:hypothetical protein